MLKIREYRTPEIEFIELVQDAAIMVQSSTGESYGPQDVYDGIWS